MSKKSPTVKKLDMNRIERFVRFYKKLHQMPKIALTMLVFALVAIPVSVWDIYRTNQAQSKPVDLLAVEGAAAPRLITHRLTKGTVNQPYTQNVVMTDPDSLVTSLHMSFDQLPTGVTMQSCQKLNEHPATMSCTLAGVPQQAGKYTVNVTLQDEGDILIHQDLLLEITH